MSYQAVRGFFQKLTYDALIAAGVPAGQVHFDNFGETASPPDQSYALVFMSFGQGIDDVVGCEGVENLNGSLQVNLYTPKQQGSKQGEDTMLEVIKAWSGLSKRFARYVALWNHTSGLSGRPLPALGPFNDYANARVIFYEPEPTGEYENSKIVSAAGNRLKDDWPNGFASPEFDPGTVDYDNADIQPRSDIGFLTPHPVLEQAVCLSIDGPATLAPDQRPHHVNVASCVWKARVA